MEFVLPITLLIFTDILAARSKILTLGQPYPSSLSTNQGELWLWYILLKSQAQFLEIDFVN